MHRYRDVETHKLHEDIKSFAPYVKIPKAKFIIPKKD